MSHYVQDCLGNTRCAGSGYFPKYIALGTVYIDCVDKLFFTFRQSARFVLFYDAPHPHPCFLWFFLFSATTAFYTWMGAYLSTTTPTERVGVYTWKIVSYPWWTLSSSKTAPAVKMLKTVRKYRIMRDQNHLKAATVDGRCPRWYIFAF